MQEMSDLNHEGETLLYPRMVITDCCPTAELAERIAANSTFSPGEAAGLIRQLADEMAAVMASGRSVRLDGIGTFTPTLALEHDKKREAPDGSGSRRNATSIRVGGVGFRVNRRLVSETDRCAIWNGQPAISSVSVRPTRPKNVSPVLSPTWRTTRGSRWPTTLNSAG